MTEASDLVYMSAKQVAEYLDLNEKKVYAMANDRILPATKITGKWLFPKILIDRWIMDSCHSGMLTDRLLITGSDDPLLSMLVARLMSHVGSRELISYSATGSRLGLDLLSKAMPTCVPCTGAVLMNVIFAIPRYLRAMPTTNNGSWYMATPDNRD